jgi:uncharacterized integral membrane protein
MRVLLLVLKIVLFLLMLGFAFRNTDNVVVHYLPGAQWQAPLVVVLLVCFGIGIAAGVTASLGIIVRQRREILRLKRGAASAAVSASAVAGSV